MHPCALFYSCLAQAALREAADGNSSEDESDDGEDESGDEEALAEAQAHAAASSGAARPPIYNVEALHSALEDISWPEAASWEESLAVTSDDAEQVRWLHCNRMRKCSREQSG